MNENPQEHWDAIYASKPIEQLGWYEAVPEPSLQLLARCKLSPDDPILDIGAGASTFIDSVLERGYRDIIAADISPAALTRLQERLGQAKASRVRWIVDDVTRPVGLLELQGIALWHDRACLHFLLHESQRQAYLATLKRVLSPGGDVIVAAFALSGAKRCSGLDVRNYDAALLAEFLGQEFELLESFGYLYHMPSGDPRPYVYACFRRRIMD